jgi:uncharacterized protein (UPF0335 family)
MARRPRNQPPEQSEGNSPGSVNGGQLKSILERIEHLQDEKKALADDIREIFAEARGNGFDAKIIRIVLQRRAADRTALAERDAMVDLYSRAVGVPSPAEAGTGENEE